jgi:hypothetical protein
MKKYFQLRICNGCEEQKLVNLAGYCAKCAEPKKESNMKLRYVIWRRYYGEIGSTFMTNKPGENHTWDADFAKAHHFTYKQACHIIHEFEKNRHNGSSETWGKEVVYD